MADYRRAFPPPRKPRDDADQVERTISLRLYLNKPYNLATEAHPAMDIRIATRSARLLSRRALQLQSPRAPYARTTPLQPIPLYRQNNLPACRPFSISAPARAKAIVNAKKDEHGQEMIIDITPRASDVSISITSSRFYAMSLTILLAITQHSEKRFEPFFVPTCLGRVWWMPWLPVSHVPDLCGQNLARRRHSV